MVLSIAYTMERERAMGHTLPMSYTLAYTTEYWMWYNLSLIHISEPTRPY